MANSSDWKCDIEKIIDSYYTLIQKSAFANYIKFYPDRIEKMYELYEVLLCQTKDMMKNISKNDDYVDHHKIIAMYIKSILIVKPFEFNKTLYNSEKEKLSKKPNLLSLFPNHYISWHILLCIISSWSKHKDGKNINDYITKYPDSIFSYKTKRISKYDEHFMKLLYTFKEDLNNIPVFSLSHIIFFIELSSDCIFYKKSYCYYSNNSIN